jgi:DNA (cytosine-5)-methyltransferase 1
MRILNLYSGLGGNRKLWKNVDVTAVEYDEEIARIYHFYFPNDELIIGDAHSYLENNFKNFDFIWSSPPCQSHSKIRMMASKSGSYNAIMPDMNLWAEIIFLKHYSGCPYVVENVKPYYEPLVLPTQILGRHYFWSNFEIPNKDMNDGLSHNDRGKHNLGVFDLREFKTKKRKDQLIRNSVDPLIGEYILKLVS